MDNDNVKDNAGSGNGNAGASGSDEKMKCSQCGGAMHKEGDKWVGDYCKHEMPA